jgi:DNA mismatch endonuclease (patch repair protein)
MQAVSGRDTAPELFVRKRLFSAGFRYRLHDKRLSGRPDIVLSRFKVVVFVNGCFWHGHSCPKGKRPATNEIFWNIKIDKNIARDRENYAALAASGWHVVVIWQCELEHATTNLIELLTERRRTEDL